jgi:hypothetical protein
MNVEGPTKGMQRMETEGSHEGKGTMDTMESLSESTIILTIEGPYEGNLEVGNTTEIPQLI